MPSRHAKYIYSTEVTYVAEQRQRRVATQVSANLNQSMEKAAVLQTAQKGTSMLVNVN